MWSAAPGADTTDVSAHDKHRAFRRAGQNLQLKLQSQVQLQASSCISQSVGVADGPAPLRCAVRAPVYRQAAVAKGGRLLSKVASMAASCTDHSPVWHRVCYPKQKRPRKLRGPQPLPFVQRPSRSESPGTARSTRSLNRCQASRDACLACSHSSLELPRVVPQSLLSSGSTSSKLRSG